MTGFVLRRLEPDAQAIARRYADGESFEDLARDYACGWGTIRRFLISQQVSLRREPRKRKLDTAGAEVVGAFLAGAEISEIATRHGVQAQTVRNYLLERGAMLTATATARATAQHIQA